MELIKASNIYKSFGKKKVLNGVDISLYAGECVALIGANGAGKTTLCEILQGLKKPNSGTVSLFGHDLYKISASQKNQLFYDVGVMMQETTLYKRYTVHEVIKLFVSFYNCKESYQDLLTKLDLTAKLNVQLRKLSGGQRQKLYLLLALLHKPKLLFLDEPTTGVDIKSRTQIWSLINHLKQTGSTILLTTHYMEEAEQLASRIVILSGGLVIANGSQKQLSTEFINYSNLLIIAKQIEDVAAISNALQKNDLIKNINILEDKIEAVIDHSLWKPNLISDIFSDLDCQLHKVQIQSGTLEDVYHNLTAN